jgi:arsenate reductase
MIFICYPKCSTCQKAQKWLTANQIHFELRDITANNPSYEELKTWYKKGHFPLRKFFNTSGVLYRSFGLKDKLNSMSEEEQLRLLASDGMLVKRPLLINDDFILLGFQESNWTDVLIQKP